MKKNNLLNSTENFTKVGETSQLKELYEIAVKKELQLKEFNETIANLPQTEELCKEAVKKELQLKEFNETIANLPQTEELCKEALGI